MKNLMILAICSIIISSCSKKVTDDITPNGTTSTANTAAKYKTSFTISGAQYGSLTYNFAKDGSQIERYDGVIEKDWNIESKLITVKFDSTKITLNGIQQLIAKSGYDNDGYYGDDYAYAKLPACCQYDRKPFELK